VPTSTTSQHDVVVVGGRLAGAATAMLLARAGLDVLVVDRGRSAPDVPSTHALMRSAVVQLDRWGLLDDVIASGTPPVRRTTSTAGGEVTTISVKPSYGVDALYAPRRGVLDPLLARAAVRAGADVRRGTTVHALTRDQAGRITGVAGRDGRGNAVVHTARWVIGADGIRSTVAREAEAPAEARGVAATAIVYGYWSDVPADAFEWLYDRDACAGILPTDGGQACVFAAASPPRVRGGVDALRQLVTLASPALTQRLAAGRAPADVRGGGGRPGFLRRAWGPGWALVGSAGAWTDPIGGHGLTEALRDAELLATALVEVASGERPERDALADFHATRDRLARPVLDVVDAIAGLRWTDDEIVGLLMRLRSALSDEVEALARLSSPLPSNPHMNGARR
jgi:2-polyprenyl-6-methoxyphenol hydroxylase-like FAD-dependent oxidoreductase